MKISFKKNWLLLPAVVLFLNLFFTGEVFAQAVCNSNATSLAACTSSGGNWEIATSKCICQNGSDVCAIDTDCQSGYKCDTEHGYKCVKADTGNIGGGGTGGGGVSVGGNCGGDPNLAWDSQAKICLPKGQQCTPGSLACAGSLTELALMVINFLLIFSGIVAVGFIIIGGYWYITAAGNEEQSEKGKKALVNAIIGIVIVTLAFLIVKVVSNTLNSKNFGDKSTAFLSKVSQ